jgi:cell wall-associated NlpC family hydrolase
MSLPRSARAAATATFVLVAGLPGVFTVTAPSWAAAEPAGPPPAPPRLTVPPAVTRPVVTAPWVPPPADLAALPERPAAPRLGPLAARVDEEAARVEALTERLVEEREVLRQLTVAAVAAGGRWAVASDRYHDSRGRLDTWARGSYVRLVETGTTAPGPMTELLSTRAVGRDEGRRLAADLADATGAVGVSGDAYAVARRAADDAGATVRALEAEHARRSAALATLRARHRAELEAARVATDRHNAALSRRYLGAAGFVEAPAGAVARAVEFALAQLGKPYVWGAEGPDAYDCSGLVQAAYAAAGVALPRTARPQYLATVPVPVAAMIPGDLLFFGPDPGRWSSIHHVGIYLGRGLMAHAPTTGDVVRVAPIWWAEFFGATRVVGATGAVAGDTVAIPVAGRPAAPVARPARPPARTTPRVVAAPPRPVPVPSGSSPPAPAQRTAAPACPAHRVPPLPVLGSPPSVSVQPDPRCPPAPTAPPPCPAPLLDLALGPVRLTVGTAVTGSSPGASCPPS